MNTPPSDDLFGGVDLDALPRRNGFRLRGHAMTRVETFTDAAFAFAVTLLVISIGQVPSSYAQMIEALINVPIFLVSFVLLLLFWYGHVQWSRRFGLEDLPSVILSGALIFTVLVYVYPLRFLLDTFANFVSRGTMGREIEPIQLIELSRLFVLYGLGFTAMASLIALLYAHGWRRREALRLNALERFDTRTEIRVWALLAGSGLLSVIVALIVPATWAGIPGWVYMVLPVVMPIHGVWTERRRKKVVEQSAASA